MLTHRRPPLPRLRRRRPRPDLADNTLRLRLRLLPQVRAPQPLHRLRRRVRHRHRGGGTPRPASGASTEAAPRGHTLKAGIRRRRLRITRQLDPIRQRRTPRRLSRRLPPTPPRRVKPNRIRLRSHPTTVSHLYVQCHNLRAAPARRSVGWVGGDVAGAPGRGCGCAASAASLRGRAASPRATRHARRRAALRGSCGVTRAPTPALAVADR